MGWHFNLFICIYLFKSVNGFSFPENCGEDTGKPLFLTPFIENGSIAEGRRLSRVAFTEKLQMKSYAGYFTVNKKYNSNQFFWYFPAMVPPIKDAPVLVWLQGGPGTSSMYGLFSINGPLQVRNKKFERRNITWALNHHIIYIDNPVGTGFSFTNSSAGYCNNQVQVGKQLYSAIVQFFQLFPNLRRNKFFVAGESYGGKYGPALAYTIHKKNPTADIKINLKGIAIGNGLCDPANQLMYGKYLYQIGLIDWNQAKIFEKYENLTRDYIHAGKWKDAFDNMETLLFGDKSIFSNMTGFDFIYNYLEINDYKDKEFLSMLQTNVARKDIHVGKLTFHDGRKVLKYLKQDVMKSIAPWISELLDHYYFLIFNGQLDIIVPYPVTVHYLRNLNFTGSDEYKTTKRYIWQVDGDVAGYVKQAGKLVEVLVRKAGHMVPTDQPKWALDLITRFTHRKPYSKVNNK